MRNLPEDYSIVVQLLKAKLDPGYLTQCFNILKTRGNLKDDHVDMVTLGVLLTLKRLFLFVFNVVF